MMIMVIMTQNGENSYEMITKWSWNIVNVILQMLHVFLLIGMMVYLIKIYNYTVLYTDYNGNDMETVIKWLWKKYKI